MPLFLNNNSEQNYALYVKIRLEKKSKLPHYKDKQLKKCRMKLILQLLTDFNIVKWSLAVSLNCTPLLKNLLLA